MSVIIIIVQKIIVTLRCSICGEALLGGHWLVASVLLLLLLSFRFTTRCGAEGRAILSASLQRLGVLVR